MRTSEIIKYYSNKKIREKILGLAEHREVIPRYSNGGFGKRPQIILYDNEIMNLVRNGVSSFHASQEIWQNPMLLDTNMRPDEVADLRIGWDFIMDIDTKYFEYARIAAHVLIEALKAHNVFNYSVKFSGGTGFHIAVPWEAFLKKNKENGLRRKFPEAPIIITSYLKELIKKELRKKLLEYSDGFENLMKRTGLSFDKLVEIEGNDKFFNPYSLIGIDTVLLSSRHLFRMPFVFNEKTWLISQPCKDPVKFEIEMAKPENVNTELGFLEQKSKGEGVYLLKQAYEWFWYKKSLKNEEIVDVKDKTFEAPKRAVEASHFPPCIKRILGGLSDGRKRSVFILTNFLRSCGWSQEMVEKKIRDWNKKNKPPLKENFLVQSFKNKKIFPPPNCDNEGYYKDIGVCVPDDLCSKIKNPVSYTLRRSGSFKKTKKIRDGKNGR